MAGKITVYTSLNDGSYSSGPVKNLAIKGGKAEATEEQAEWLLRVNAHAFSKDPKRFPKPVSVEATIKSIEDAEKNPPAQPASEKADANKTGG